MVKKNNASVSVSRYHLSPCLTDPADGSLPEVIRPGAVTSKKAVSRHAAIGQPIEQVIESFSAAPTHRQQLAESARKSSYLN